MKINDRLCGGVRYYVSILPALFPVIVILTLTATSRPLRTTTSKIEVVPIAERIRQIYTSQIGVREKGTNSGPAVEQYLRYVGLPKGNPWCAAFVCWVFGQAGVSNPRSGWSPDLFPDSKTIWNNAESGKLKACLSHRQGKNGVLSLSPAKCRGAYPPLAGAGGGFACRPSTPTTGDIFGLYFPEKRRIAHTGFIDQWDGTWLITVEGNTNISGSREGDGVYRKRRLVNSIYKVARYIKY
ncbi:MAG: hypothetical protein V4721_02495 [Bacteroidota bacterium]